MQPEADVTEYLRKLYPRLIESDMTVVGLFADKATVDSPLGGKQLPAEFVTEAHSWLGRHKARSEEVHTVVAPERVVHELELSVTVDDEARVLPVILIADVEDDHIRDLRIYHSTWPLTRTHMMRHPLIQYSLTERPQEPVGTYHEALEAADADAADSVFEPDGCVREPAGGSYVYCGADRTAWYRAILSQGPIVLHLGTITDDGETVVYEYMADRWGSEPMTPQAGAAAYQRGSSGKLTSARIYDDVQPPESLGDL
jgi:hypothetical protein